MEIKMFRYCDQILSAKNYFLFLTDSPHWSRQCWPPQQLECKETLEDNNNLLFVWMESSNILLTESFQSLLRNQTWPHNTLTTQKISPHWPSLFVLTVWDWRPYVLSRNSTFVWHLNTNLPEDDTECHACSNNQELRVQFGLDWWSTWDLFPLSHSSLVYSLFSTTACSFSVFRWGNSPANVPIWNSSVAWWVKLAHCMMECLRLGNDCGLGCVWDRDQWLKEGGTLFVYVCNLHVHASRLCSETPNVHKMGLW